MEPSQVRLEDLMADILAAMAQDMPWLLGADITAYRQDTPIVFATYGVGAAVQEVQQHYQTGPTRDAAITNGPVTCDDLWNDRRWRRLDLTQACVLHPQHSRVLQKVRRVAALPGLQDDTGLVVISAYLGEASTDEALDILTRYERLVTADVAVLSTVSGTDQRTSRVLAALHRRNMVEQAKGVIMAACRTDPVMAWLLLQDASRRSHTTLQALAGELLKQVQDDPGETAKSATGQAARDLWSALRHIHTSTEG
ncbi:ANTAR domain-containing protein [Actinocrispum wychmicini]|uniref:ANTAR domain-containing protein n=1 Tax=Actinocrispum wychmicini TaxID=1213861 RepID=A0A4R2ITA6_9PSEU|nr:ANTAR domain-containing protein [Actinocrispum wychmicini]TCO47378.1 ANTAR domain-containing protein [Actinocrispum wychmicini]